MSQIPKSADYVAWEARRAECLRIGHEWQGDNCKHCGTAKHGHAKHTRPKPARKCRHCLFMNDLSVDLDAAGRCQYCGNVEP